MTSGLDELPRILSIYRDHPLDNGDLALITDTDVVQECERAADMWDPRVRSFVGELLDAIGPGELVVAIARPDAVLLPQDHALWADLREDCLAAGIRLRDPIGLPAAA